ncbi:uncharacterized protein BJX67DRAFT_379138 [Aspergillus lucknowensis]|uniref:Uncharacterized protein n=1 Tax=Aspergillus lucknowensis TaxID=176173 RepID=A0ABR4LYI9_9EURO
MAFSWLSEKSRVNEEPPNYAEATATAPAAASGPSPPPSPAVPPAAHASTPAISELDRSPLKGHETKYAMLSIAWSDRFRLVRFPEPMTALFSEIVQHLWPKGIQRVQGFDESLEIKLRGNPFGYGADEEKVAIRITLMGVLNAFAKEGWVVVPGGGRVGRMGNYNAYGQKDSLIFKYEEPRAYSWLCISFDSADLLHLINAPTELANSLISFFGERVEKCNKDFVSGNFELKFQGQPWGRNSGKGGVQSRLLVLDLMQCLEEQGYTMCTGLDIDGGDGGSTYKSYGELWFWYR